MDGQVRQCQASSLRQSARAAHGDDATWSVFHSRFPAFVYYLQVLIDGVDIKNFSVKYLRSKIGLVGQEPIMFRCGVYGEGRGSR